MEKTLTDTELAMCRLLGARYVSRDCQGSWETDCYFWNDKPDRRQDEDNGEIRYWPNRKAKYLGSLNTAVFETGIRKGECVCAGKYLRGKKGE